MSNSTMRFIRAFFVTAALFLVPSLYAAEAPSVPAALPVLKTEEIVARMTAANLQRASLLRGYQGRRSYSLEYHGFPSQRAATLEVVAHYAAPDKKRFEVIGESGSKMLQNKVLLKLLESEREAASRSGKHNSDLNTENYSFALLGTRPSPYGGCYRLEVTPRREDKFLYRGEICVNAADFAVESVDAEPARNPSFWIRKTRIEHRYRKFGEFWLPESNHTVTNVRLGGTATLKINYSNYELQTQ